MVSDIYTIFDHPDYLVSFIPSFNQPPYDEEDDDFLRLITAASSSMESLLPLPQLLSLQDLPPPPPQFQEPVVFPSYSVGEGSMQRSNSTHRMGSGMGSPGNSRLFGGEGGQGIIRRVYSTGDLLAKSKSYTVGEGVVVVRAAERYSAQERKERIEKYRAKRNLRNFNKTIKYACRKTLADSRPRIRGRFARNDDVPYAAATPPPRPAPRLCHCRHVDSSTPLWEEDEVTEEVYMNQL
ncbi:hypothetical protein MLD38_013944 [Melastoma candidum]|uniref:Uncharacterized protein n=1 Tax=Melastoma candidum TaxID=119954 RepID=A0ACB9RBB8_9MYRT|nr:hypothetical protein MLD38_013944 [Melastoma candidum]